ncbi:hypothetical protein PFTANZ_06524, partial [Plasmodium falciparum Tanzania (2000708)]
WKKDIEFREHYCTGCFSACSLYKIWIGKQKEEFLKQKKKYENEIQKYVSKKVKTNSTINNEYYNVYKNFNEKNYETNNNFLNFLKEGKYCKESVKDENTIDFNSGVDNTFSDSKHCKVCPYCGLDCDGTKCKPKPEIYTNCVNKDTYDPPDDAESTDINVIDSGNAVNISEKLNDFCTNPTNPNDKIYQKWQCYYKSSKVNKCQMTSLTQTLQKHHYVMTFYIFFDLWVKNLLKDTMKWENEIKDCINNTNVTDCNNKCNKNCVCFDKWVKQKKKEWDIIKKLFKTEKDEMKNYYININKNFELFFFRVMYELNNEEEKWNKLIENLRTKIDSSRRNTGNEDSEGVIKVLFEHLKEIAEKCTHNNSNESCETSTNRTPNPCANTTGAVRLAKSVEQLASEMQTKAKAQLGSGSDKGESALKGKAEKGDYSRGGSGDDFKNNLCGITQKHSNAIGASNNPCNGKDNNKLRFKVGTTWKSGQSVSTSTDVYLPPRREHFCTSNLEYINISKVKDGNSLLGDVLLSAKYQAEHTMNDYKLENDIEGKCRAVRRSFADIGDIIKGTDLWDQNNGEQKTQRRLDTVFGIIKKQFNGKYTNDSKHTQLRKDWWEANRDQIWKAMQCPSTTTPHVTTNCDKEPTPLDDYIPQRLRWMTEWAEWYCKYQSQEYEKLKRGCEGCTSAKCETETKCKVCKAKCQEYEQKIIPWKQQWETISKKYDDLYQKAKQNDDTSSNKDADVVKFLSELYKTNNGKSDANSDVYSTAARYVHQELPNMGCNVQIQFCKHKNGSTSSGKDNDKEYAFREKPHDHDDKCDCTDKSTPPLRRLLRLPRYLIRRRFRRHRRRRPPQNVVVGGAGRILPAPEKPIEEEESDEEDPSDSEEDHVNTENNDQVEVMEETVAEVTDIQKAGQTPPAPPVVDVCKIVDGILNGKSATDYIDGCNKKSYNGWNCKPSDVHSDHAGACMPPRRQKLCIYYFGNNTQIPIINSQDILKEAFIKSAAGETFLSWQKYKTDNNGGADLQIKLESGIIPEDFKRKMFYTFGDLRDFLFGTDISKKHGEKSELKNKIDFLFENT